MNQPILSKIEGLLRGNYTETFLTHGATLQGLDWKDEENAQYRYNNMLGLIKSLAPSNTPISILDVGCGYARFFEYLCHYFGPDEIHKHVEYTGIDIVEEMIEHCQKNYPDLNFFHRSAFEMSPNVQYDFVFCNGILTKKCSATQIEMTVFSETLIKRLFSLCKKGVYFNLFSNQVGWFESVAYYKSPVEMLAYCLQLTSCVVINHTIPRYEYFVYLYREEVFEKA